MSHDKLYMIVQHVPRVAWPSRVEYSDTGHGEFQFFAYGGATLGTIVALFESSMMHYLIRKGKCEISVTLHGIKVEYHATGADYDQRTLIECLAQMCMEVG